MRATAKTPAMASTYPATINPTALSAPWRSRRNDSLRTETTSALTRCATSTVYFIGFSPARNLTHVFIRSPSRLAPILMEGAGPAGFRGRAAQRGRTVKRVSHPAGHEIGTKVPVFRHCRRLADFAPRVDCVGRFAVPGRDIVTVLSKFGGLRLAADGTMHAPVSADLLGGGTNGPNEHADPGSCT